MEKAPGVAYNPLSKTPPNSLEAEHMILGCMLADATQVPVVLSIVEPGDYYQNLHAEIHKVIVELFNSKYPTDHITVGDKLIGKGCRPDDIKAYLTELILGVGSMENVAHHAKMVRDKATLRAVREAGLCMASMAYEADAPAEAIVQSQELMIQVTRREFSDDSMTTSGRAVDNMMKTLEERMKNPVDITGVPSGFPVLDNEFTCGFQKDDLIILAARPSMGKTAFMLNVIEEVCIRQGQPFLAFSLEMSKESLVQRMVSSLSGVNAYSIKKGRITAEQFAKVEAAAELVRRAPLFIDDRSNLTPGRARIMANRMYTETGGALKMISIDYLQLMEVDGNGRGDGNRNLEISAISRGLKQIARDLHLPVMALSQLSRGVESRQDKKPLLSDLRDSGAIEQDADLVLFLYRDEYYNKDSDRVGEGDVIVAKQRNGPVGEVQLIWNPLLAKYMNPVWGKKPPKMPEIPIREDLQRGAGYFQ